MTTVFILIVILMPWTVGAWGAEGEKPIPCVFGAGGEVLGVCTIGWKVPHEVDRIQKTLKECAP